MDSVTNSNTEENIIAAAEVEFIEKGKAGARMQHIADKAGINKSLLHYYYRSKDKLFEIVFITAFKYMIPKISNILNGDYSLEEKIKKFTYEYITFVGKRPNIPVFIMHELSYGGQRLRTLIDTFNIDFSALESQLKDEIEKGNIRPIKVEELVINTISLCIFPIVAKPIITSLIFAGNDEEYKNMLEVRRTHVSEFIINSIKIYKDDKENI